MNIAKTKLDYDFRPDFSTSTTLKKIGIYPNERYFTPNLWVFTAADKWKIRAGWIIRYESI